MADPGIPYLGAAFGIAWVAMAAYFVRLARAQRDIDRKLSATRSEATRTNEPPQSPEQGTHDVR
jgi:CcmD family protein